MTKSIALPMFVGMIDKETKYSGDPHFRITSVYSESVNSNHNASDYDGRDIALNCDNLNRNLAIKEEKPANSFENANFFLLNSNSDCDTKTTTTTTSSNETVHRLSTGGIKRATNNTTTYLCHRCRQVFGSRDSFELHYK